MTSAIGVEHTVRRKRYHLHCACGATVVASEKTATCVDCGQTVVFHGRPMLARRHHHEHSGGGLSTAFLMVLLLLAPFLVVESILSVATYPDWIVFTSDLSADQITVESEPTDCGLFTDCHYERHDIHFKDKQGEHMIVKWQRVND